MYHRYVKDLLVIVARYLPDAATYRSFALVCKSSRDAARACRERCMEEFSVAREIRTEKYICYFKALPNGKMHGSALSYYHNGQVYSCAFFVNGLPEGKATTWDEEGNALQIESYHNGVRDGEQMSFYPDGSYRCISNYEHGLLEGDHYTYHEPPASENEEGGNMESYCYYHRGQLEGEYLEWHPDGNPRAAYLYHRGQRDGEATLWSEAGVVISHGYYHQGRASGPWYFVDDDGEEMNVELS